MRTKAVERKKRITKAVAVLMAILTAFLSAVISTGAITVRKDDKEYILRSHTPTTGDINVLMIRIGFADYPVDDEEYPADSEETLLSYFDGGADSVNGFYETSSYGKLHLHCNKVYSYNAANSRYEYGGENSGSMLSEEDLIRETFSALGDKIDPDSYDSDGDGYLDFVCFDFSGPMGEWASVWWPHVYTSDKVMLGDKTVNTYSFLRGEASVFIHEFGHILGAADYYSTNDGSSNCMMTYAMMCVNAGDHDGFTKWSYGWLDDDDISFVDKTSGDTTVTLAPIETSLGDGKKIAVIAPSIDRSNGFLDEYFVVEYDSGVNNNEDVFSKYSYEPGFRIFHVNAKCFSGESSEYISFAKNNASVKDNLIHNVKNELIDPAYWAESDMFFREGDSLTPENYPNTGLSSDSIYNGLFTGISFTDFVTGDHPSFKVSFSDDVVSFPDPVFSLTFDSLTSDIRITLDSDQPLSQKKRTDEDYAAPYLIDANGTKLTLDVTSNDSRRFKLNNPNPYPAVAPDTEYTLVIPEGYFMTGYMQKVKEFRQSLTTDHFLPLTTILRYNETVGILTSNTFGVTENTFGRIDLYSRNKKCDFIEFNLNGEEISRVPFDLPPLPDSDPYLLGCGVFTLYDGNFALCIFDLDNTYFTKIDRSGSILSNTFTVSNTAVFDYADNVQTIRFEPFKDGLFKPLTSSDSRSQILLTFDFENGLAINKVNANYTFVSLSKDRYAVLNYSTEDNQQHIYVYNNSDEQTADIVLDHIYMGMYMKDGRLNVLSKKIDYSDDKSVTTYYIDSYNQNGTKIDSKEITQHAEYLADQFLFDRVIATNSGYYLVVNNDYERKTIVIACDSDWDKLGEFNLNSYAGLVFLGECGLSTEFQYFAEEREGAYLISRFNIGDFEIIPKREQLLGDADGDGTVTILDATYIQRRLANLSVPDTFSEKAGCVDGGNKLVITDATYIQRWLAGIPVTYRIGESMT